MASSASAVSRGPMMGKGGVGNGRSSSADSSSSTSSSTSSSSTSSSSPVPSSSSSSSTSSSSLSSSLLSSSRPDASFFKQQNKPPKCFDIFPFQSIKCKIHPVVIFTILDSFVRREEDQDNVIGTLLGIVADGNVIEITDCFVDRHSLTDQGLLQIMKDHHESMYDLKQQVNPKECVVGWFCTANVMTELTCAVHGWFKQFSAVSKFTPQPPLNEPIHLMVDTSLDSGSLTVKAFMQVQMTIVRDACFQFQEIPLQIYTSNSDRNGIRIMLKAKKQQEVFEKQMHLASSSMSSSSSSSAGGRHGGRFNKFQTAALEADVLSQQKPTFEAALERLFELLNNTSRYIDTVLDGTTKRDPEIGRYLWKALSNDIAKSPEQMDQLCQSNLQDNLMMSYLVTLARVQFAMAERLNTSFF